MTTNDSFERRLSEWLDESSEHRVPDHLGEALMQTVATQQRAAWSSLERWLPVSTIARRRLAFPAPVLPLVVLGLLVLGLVAALLLAVGRPRPLVLTPASNGRIVFVDGPSIMSAAADGSGPRTLVAVPQGASNLVFSPDGSHLAYLVESAGHLEVAPLTQGSASGTTPAVVAVPGLTIHGQPSWSPDGARLTFVAEGPSRDHLFIASPDGSAPREIGADVIDQAVLSWPTWSPDGTQIAFVGGLRDAGYGHAFLIRPDGTELLALDHISTLDTGDGGSLAWSPDPAVQQLLYVGSGNLVKLYDVATSKELDVADGFWPTWSPVGDRIAYWHDGTKVIAVSDVIKHSSRSLSVFAPFSANCPDVHDRARTAFCGPAAWSPDGSRLIAPDLEGSVMLSLRSDGSGEPIVIPIGPVNPVSRLVAWQPIRG